MRISAAKVEVIKVFFMGRWFLFLILAKVEICFS
jgi:hypothetical protein